MTVNDLSGKRIAVLGYGQEGQTVIRYLLRHGIKPVLFDQRLSNNDIPTEIESVLGPDCLDQLIDFNVAFRSPGIWRNTPALLTAESAGLIITSQIKWFMDQWHDRVIGITGTKGKGTTSALIAHLLTEALNTNKLDNTKAFNLKTEASLMLNKHSRVFLTGNIGKIQPLEIIDDLTPNDVVVYEMSSFQLQDLQLSPKIGVILMTTSEHLDHHADLTEYHHAKQSIAAYQQAGDTMIINDDFPASQEIGKQGHGQKLYFSRDHKVTSGCYVQQDSIVITSLPNIPQIISHPIKLLTSLISLRGAHNQENVMAGILAGISAGIHPDILTTAISTFKGLPHRLQQLPSHDGIQFYDDSFATVPENTIAAINSFDGPITLILGGSDKGADFTELAKHIVGRVNVKNVILIGTVMAPKIGDALKNHSYSGTIMTGFKDLAPAMLAIKKISQAGDTVLLSPACASFDSYNNYVERGNHFQEFAAQWDQL